MNRTKLRIAFCMAWIPWLAAVSSVSAGDWMTYRSTYTHDALGQRVDQHTQPIEPLSPDQGNLVRSGYRHYRSTIQGSTTADNLHITHEWGRPVMPYEHWRFPYRPFGVPYDQWGPPVPNVLSNFNYQGNGWPGALPIGPGPIGAGNGLPSAQPLPAMPGMPAPVGPGYGYGPAYPNGLGNGFGYGNGQGFGNGYGGGFGYPAVPRSAPWIDGLYPSAPPLR